MSELIFNKVIYKTELGVGIIPITFLGHNMLLYIEVLLIIPKNNPIKKYLSFNQKVSYKPNKIIKSTYKKYSLISILKEQEKYVLINTLNNINYTIDKRTELKPFKDRIIFLIKLILN